MLSCLSSKSTKAKALGCLKLGRSGKILDEQVSCMSGSLVRSPLARTCRRRLNSRFLSWDDERGLCYTSPDLLQIPDLTFSSLKTLITNSRTFTLSKTSRFHLSIQIRAISQDHRPRYTARHRKKKKQRCQNTHTNSTSACPAVAAPAL
jgi:hypothetical protein